MSHVTVPAASSKKFAQAIRGCARQAEMRLLAGSDGLTREERANSNARYKAAVGSKPPASDASRTERDELLASMTPKRRNTRAF